MAKIIRCPNCGENVEVAANPAGQIVTCIACGTAMRLKSKKDAGDKPRGDASQGSLSGTLSGSMSATRITDNVQASPDDPPSLGGECEVCGRPTDPDELIEDRGHLTCRDCIKGARSSRPRAAKLGDGDLIPFAGPTSGGSRRGKMLTFGFPFFAGTAALAIYVACDLFLAFNPKPVGKGVVAQAVDEPAPSAESAWDKQNRPIIEKMMAEAAALEADPAKAKEARDQYDKIVAMAKGQQSGSKEVTALINQAERKSEALKTTAAAAASAAGNGEAPDSTPPAVTDPANNTIAGVTPADLVVPEDTAPPAESMFTDPDVRIANLLETGIMSLEAALAQPGDAAIPHATAAKVTFSQARGELNEQRRNAPDDPARSLANHGTAIAHMFLREYPLAMRYMDFLPPPPNRATIINRVVILLQTREEKLAAIQLLLGLLGSDPEGKDTYAVNLLGTALARYPDETIQAEKELRDAKLTYTSIVKKLAEQHPGERRWGVRWVSPREFDAALRDVTLQKNQLTELERKLRIAQARIKEYTGKSMRAGDLATAHRDEQTALQLIAGLRATMTTEEWLTPEQILPVLPDVSALNNATRDSTTQPTAGG